MTIRNFEQHKPSIATNAWVDDSAVVIGDVTLGAESSVWPMAVLRGDINSIKVGERSNIQDGSVVHVTHRGPFTPDGYTTSIGNDVTIGHACIVHGCTIGDRCLIGMRSCIMDGAILEADIIIGAGSLVTPGKVLQSGYLWVGSPARQVRELTTQEREQLLYSANYYKNLMQRHRTECQG